MHVLPRRLHHRYLVKITEIYYIEICGGFIYYLVNISNYNISNSLTLNVMISCSLTVNLLLFHRNYKLKS